MEESKVEGKKKKVNIIDILGYVLIGFITLLIIYIFWSRASGNIPFIGRYSLMYVQTGSMSPLIPEKSYILVKKATAEEIEIEDVIVFVSDDPVLNGAYNTHRVVSVVGDHEEFITKGDNNPTEDKYTAKGDKIIAKYVCNIPFLTAVGRILSTTTGLTMTLTVIFALLMLMYIPDMKRATKEREEELKAEKAKYIDELVKAEIEKLKAQGGAPSEQNQEPVTETEIAAAE